MEKINENHAKKLFLEEIERFQELRGNGNIPKAASVITGLIKQNPDIPELHNALAEMEYELGNREKSLEILMHSVEKWPENIKILNNLGVILYETGQVENAIDFFKKALKINPGHRDSIINAGNIYLETKKHDEAIMLFESYLNNHPDDNEIKTLIESAGAKTCGIKNSGFHNISMEPLSKTDRITYRVLTNGGFHQEDMKYLEGPVNIEIKAFNQVETDTEELLRMSDNINLFLLRGNVLQIESFFSRHQNHPDFFRLWNRRDIRKAAWSMDSHHAWPQEIKIQDFFDTYYIAHSEYIEKFAPGKAYWMPCCFEWFPIDKAIELVLQGKKITQFLRNIIFHHFNYKPDKNLQIEDRCLIAPKILTICNQMGLQSLFGYCGKYGSEELARIIMDSQIVLNISLHSDLNMRTFEALLFNKILLSDYCDDYSKIDLDFTNVFFYKRDISDFQNILKNALSHDSSRINSAANILNKHMKMHRFISIINRELNANLSAKPVLFDNRLC